MNKQEFIEAIAKSVKKYASQYGICVYSPIIAQACLESGYGTSELAKNANNFFGLKYRAGRCPSACGVYYKVGSEQNADGSYTSSAMQWVKAANLDLGVKCYFEFINISRYSNLKGCTDPYEYLVTIKKDGYATSLNYVENVYNVIKANNLTKYDEKEEVKKDTFKVHIDPGHYGATYNKNTVGLNYYESKMTWDLANYLKNELEKSGVKVTLSRNNINANPSLYDRGYGAKNCDLFLSLHSNACGTESVDYPVVYRGIDKSVADDFGIKLATLIQNLIGTKQKGKTATRSGSNGEYYGVLRGARAAGLTYYYIVEHSFHTNYNATKWLSDDSNIRRLAQEEAKLIVNYFVKKAPINTNTTTTPEVKKYYRVRKSWEDAASQTGAYAILENAKAQCKEGYSVYDWNGKEVYSKKTEYYTVKKGDTLSKIGAKLGINWQDIAKLNNIKAPYVIYPNQKLRIK
jgi:N-acetylmuramoyl-L-alanine amidase